jgi:hypothetical protein
MIYYSIEPFGEEKADYRNGILASLIANVNGNKTKPEDFIPQYKLQNKIEPQSWQSMKQIATVITTAYNGVKKS